MIAEFFSLFLIIVTFMAFAAKRLLTYLHLFQQDEYDGARFLPWVFKNGVFDKKLTLVLLIPCALYLFVPFFISNALTMIAIAFMTYKEKDPRRDSKKKLVMTNRAKRIYITALIFAFLPVIGMLLLPAPWLALFGVQFIPFALVLGNGVLQPLEISVQVKFKSEAKARLSELDVKVIGITGSFGKTSIKHILGHILKQNAPTLVTPGSVNTPMGITRIMREELSEAHKYFIVEMGAYGPGSIERICELTPPDTGIISTIGHAHYERFKTLDAVARTKFELSEAVLKKEGGKIIVGEKTLTFPYTRDLRNAAAERFVVCGKDANSQLVIESIQQMPTGLDVRIRYNDTTHLLSAPLFGAHHGLNMALAFACACSLGIPESEAIGSLATTPQIPHRLEVKNGPVPNSLIIDDAYNSNPVGFQSALDLLTHIAKKGRRILITPGMVELGPSHDDIHKQIGTMAARACDIAIIVNSQRIPTFIEAFKNEMTANQSLEMFDTFEMAQKWVNDNIRDGDVVLIENDLPDLYERIPKL